ncbi:hypothetical protein [Mucilaginibacter antarcticus]|uniref:hypothetical protein n=1 Tax=Mucilaginibacter antarcticus TaxID=1855725 RepID=UPI00362888F3
MYIWYMAVLKINYPPVNYHHVIIGKMPLSAFLSDVLNIGTSVQIIEHLAKYHSQNGDTCQIDAFEISAADLHNDKKAVP